MHNVVLCHNLCFKSNIQYYPAEEGQANSCGREGWGSVEATEMVLNNLFYITAKVII